MNQHMRPVATGRIDWFGAGVTLFLLSPIIVIGGLGYWIGKRAKS